MQDATATLKTTDAVMENAKKTKLDVPTIKDIDIKNKTVLLRVDLNVPKNKKNEVTDTTRIDRLKPTIDYLREQNAKILILSHFGRPDGERNSQMSLAFLTPVLEKQWECRTTFAPDCIGDNTKDVVKKAENGSIVLLENVRFYKEEKSNDPDFSKSLSELADIYVNDAFSTSHRAHASTTGVAQHLPSAAGLLMEEEINALSSALIAPDKPVMAFTGGSKISTKLSVLNNLVKKMDYLVLGGAMANTFLFAKGYNMGHSMYEKDMAEEALSIMQKAKDAGCEIILPIDVVCAAELKENADHQTVQADSIPEDQSAIDLGIESINYINSKINECKTVLWNGPLGVFEIKPFDKGTNEVAKHVAKRTKDGQCISIAGGGDTVAALENAGSVADFSYISTAGGAFLEWLEGKKLPGITALIQK